MRNILLNWLPWILLVKRPGHKLERRRPFSKEHFDRNRRFDLATDGYGRSVEHTPLSLFREDSTNASNKSSDFLCHTNLDARINNCLKLIAENPALVDRSYHASLLTMQQIYYELKFITQRMKRDDEAEERKNDWK